MQHNNRKIGDSATEATSDTGNHKSGANTQSEHRIKRQLGLPEQQKDKKERLTISVKKDNQTDHK